MIECKRLIIGEVGTREREEGRLKVGRSERFRTTWAAMKVEGTTMLGTKMEAEALIYLFLS